MRVLALLAGVAACGGGHGATGQSPDAALADDAAFDAAPAGPCWPDTPRMPKGSAVLGTGRNGFEPMPEVLPLEYGTQDGFMLIANVRMMGFAPGNPDNILDPSNPRTRIQAFFDDTNVPLNFYAHCPFRTPYLATGQGDYELAEEAPIIFETCWRSEHLFGKKIRVELEILDDSGGYTTDVKVVEAAPPVSPVYPTDTGTPGCQH